MDFKTVFLPALIVLQLSALAQQPVTTNILRQTDAAISSLTHHSYQVKFRFKSAPKTDTSNRAAKVLLFADGFVRNDSLKSYVVLYPDSSRTEAFDGRYFYEINHKIRTIRMQDASQSGYRKAVSSWAADFAYLPLLRKNERHFLPSIYQKMKLLKGTEKDRSFYRLEYIDSTLNDHKIATFDPDYIVNQTIFDIDASTFQIRKIARWITFMATPQYDETTFSEIVPLLDGSSFGDWFNPDTYLKAGYMDYETYKASMNTQASQTVKLNAGDAFLAFHLPDTESKVVHSDSLKTGLLLVDFWYRSCYPCLKAMPVLENLHQKYGSKGLQVLGINSCDASATEVHEFMLSREVHYASLLDNNGVFAKAVGVKGYPTIFLIEAASKKILFQQAGYSDDTDATLDKLIQETLSGAEQFEIWEVENMTVVVKEDDPFKAKSQLVNAALNKQMQGCRYFISKDNLIVKDADQKVMSQARILEKSPASYTLQDEKGETAQLKYSLSADGNQCTFYYSNGSSLVIRKVR